MADLRGWFSWQLTRDRLCSVDSITGDIDPLPPPPHADWCYCGYCRPDWKED